MFKQKILGKIKKFYTFSMRENRLLVIALLFLFVFSITIRAFATYPATPFAPSDQENDPSCSPGDANCYVTPMAIGEAVGSGDDNSVLFIDTNGDLAEDSTNFYFDDSTDILNIDEINLPTTSSTEGIIYSNSSRFIHAYGTDNVFIGRVAGNFSLTTGSAVRNIAIGSLAVDALTTGDDNIGIGYQALTSNTIGVDNVAIGVNSLVNNSSGDANVGIGRLALQRNVSGDYNTAVGTSAFQVMGSGNYNTGIGYQALYGTTDVVAEYNTAVGAAAGASVSTGSRNTFLGAYTDLISATPTLSDSIALGYLTQIRASNQFVVGSETSAITDMYIGEGVISTGPSDVTINATGGSGTDIAGADLTLASGKGTGSAVGGDLIFSTADVGATGTTLQSLTEKMRLTYNGRLGVGTSTPLLRLDVAGSGRITGTATSVLTGSIDATASTTVTGVGTLFTTELVIGDRITVSGESRTVTAIASATSLTVDTAFTDTANDTSVDKLPAIFVTRQSDNTLAMVQNYSGNFGLGTSSPDFEFEAVSATQNIEMVATGYNGRKPVFAGRSANGTEVSPTATTAGDILAEFAGQGYGATSFASSSTASIRVVAEETFDDSGYGSQLLFRTTPNNSTTLTSRMVITADGLVGIGDTGPDNVLDIASDSNTGIAISASGADVDPYIKFELVDNTPSFTMGVDDSDSDSFKISTTALGTSDRFIIDSSGNINVGGDGTPGSLFSVGSTSQFQVGSSGSIDAVTTITTSGGIIIGVSGTGALNVGTVSGVYRTTNAGSNVTPQAIFDVDNSNSTAGSQAYIFDTNSGLVLTAANGTRRIARAAIDITNLTNTAGSETGDLAFSTKPSGAAITERLRIDASGEVGIGDTTPDYLLDVENTGVDTDIFALTDSDGACLHNPEAGTETVTCSSDERLKENIVDADSVLPYFMDFRIREYDVLASGDHMTGVVAQEVMEVYPELVRMGGNGFYTVEIPSTWQVIKGIQELKISIDDLESFDLENENSLARRITLWLNDTTNGIQNIFAKRVTVEELCVEDICITKDDLLDILDDSGSYTPVVNDDGNTEETPTDDPITEEEPVDSEGDGVIEEENTPEETPVEEEIVSDENTEELGGGTEEDPQSEEGAGGEVI